MFSSLDFTLCIKGMGTLRGVVRANGMVPSFNLIVYSPCMPWNSWNRKPLDWVISYGVFANTSNTDKQLQCLDCWLS